MSRADCVVIGAGVIGLACAAELARRGRDVLVLEAADDPGTGISSRNSEVIHAGIYYAPGSLKARFCVAGNRELKAFCETHGVPWRECGKWLVATDDAQQELLHVLRERAAANGVGLQWVSVRRQQSEEPELAARAVLESSGTGIVDSHALCWALLASAEAAGAVLAVRHRVGSYQPVGGGLELRLDAAGSPQTLQANAVVNAAGPWSGPLLLPPRPGLLRFAQGSYFDFHGQVPFRRLIYPLPDEAGLGIHLSLNLAGQARFGPDVQWVDSPDRLQVDAARRDEFAARIRRWWPGLPAAQLHPGTAGVRPKLAGPGEPAVDFCIEGEAEHGVPGLIQLLGIESPGLTAALPLARHVAERLA